MTGQADLHPVRAAVSITQIGDGAADITPGPLTEYYGLSSVFIADFPQAFFADIESLFPGDLFPLVFTAGANPLERMPDPVRMIDILG